MAAKFPPVSLFCLWRLFFLSLCISCASSQRHRSSIKGISRSRRQACLDGTYVFEGRTCCKCAAGQRVKEHCTPGNPNNRQCEQCESGTYNSVANGQKTCQPCTSCSQPNANLEEEEPCTVANNTKCRCKKDHFCSTKDCPICQACKTCGIGGNKEDCTATSDTVCNDGVGAIVGIVVAVVLVVGVIVAGGYVIWRKRQERRRQKNQEENNKSGSPEETQPLKVFSDDDLQPLLPDIANALGWKDMKNAALRMGVAMTVIESCQLDNQNDAEEQTLQLLRKYVEKEGKEAPRKLIQTLENMNKKGKAEKIRNILSKANSASSNGNN